MGAIRLGTSFSNLQVKSNDINVIKNALIKLHNDNQSKDILVMGKHKYFIGENRDWITILNVMYEGAYNNFAILLSKYISEPLFTIECFDESNLEILFIQNGEVITKHKINDEEIDIDELREELEQLKDMVGDFDEEFLSSFSNEFGDVSKIIKTFNLDVSEERLSEILKQNNINEKIASVEHLLQLDIWVKAEWIEDNRELNIKYKPFSAEY
jgi:hypothetical protein